jgi:hypothetical protein
MPEARHDLRMRPAFASETKPVKAKDRVLAPVPARVKHADHHWAEHNRVGPQHVVYH